jgi:hypothetical protein
MPRREATSAGAAANNRDPRATIRKLGALFCLDARHLRGAGHGNGTDIPRANLPACSSKDHRHQNHSAKHLAKARSARARALLTAMARSTTAFSSPVSHFFRAWPLRARQQIVKGSRRRFVDTTELATAYILSVTALIETKDGWRLILKQPAPLKCHRADTGCWCRCILKSQEKSAASSVCTPRVSAAIAFRETRMIGVNYGAFWLGGQGDEW